MASPTQIGISTYAAASARFGAARYFAFLVGAGLLNALIAAFLFLHLPDAHTPTLTNLIIRASIFVIVGALAGTIGAWYYWRRPASPFLGNPPIPFYLFALSAAAGWVWAPAVVLLSREDSPLTCPVAVLGAAILAYALRTTTPAALFLHPSTLHAAYAGDRELFAATLRTPPREFSGYILAVCIYLASYELSYKWILDAAAMLAVCAFVFLWQLTLAPSGAIDTRRQTIRATRRLGVVLLPAILFTLLALLFGIEHRNRVEAEAAAAATDAQAHGTEAGNQNQPTDRASATGLSGYQSIILWPIPPKKQIVPPIPSQTSFLAPGTTRPLIIKFDGTYWYFQPPNNRPSPRAFQVRGTPLTHDFQTNNFVRLIMDAHQTLGSSIPLNRCREIQVDILNHDNRPGAINLAVLLSESTSPANQLYLGQQLVLSSLPGSFTQKSSPVSETLKFSIPAPAKIRKFDEITVMFLPDEANYDTGSKVAIEQFQLIPR
jgi:hypothetical protein